MESWVSKQEYNYKKFADRLRKKNGNLKKDGMAEIEIPDFNLWISAGMPNDWDSNSNNVPVESNSNSNGKENNSNGIPMENPLKGTEQNIRDNINNTHTHTELGQFDSADDAQAWSPPIKTVNDWFMRAGLSSITQLQLNQELVTFNAHYENQRLSDNQRYAKLVSWVKRDQQTRTSRPKPPNQKQKPDRVIHGSFGKIGESSTQIRDVSPVGVGYEHE